MLDDWDDWAASISSRLVIMYQFSLRGSFQNQHNKVHTLFSGVKPMELSLAGLQKRVRVREGTFRLILPTCLCVHFPIGGLQTPLRTTNSVALS